MKGKLALFCIAVAAALGMVMPALAQYLGASGQPTYQPQQESAPVQDWFAKYDTVRRQAQMNPQERARCDAVMSKGLSMLMAGDQKAEAQQFLMRLANKNHTAAQQLKQLPFYPPTAQLHRGYYNYFSTAANLFADYAKVQDNLFATDANGKSLAASLLIRKQELEAMDAQNKQLDAQLRNQFGIAPYRY